LLSYSILKVFFFKFGRSKVVPFRLYWLWLQYYFFLVFVLHGAPFFTHCYQVLLLFCDKTYFIMQSHLNYYCLFMIVFICLFACSFSVLVGWQEDGNGILLTLFLSFSLSLYILTAIFPGEPGSAGTRKSPFWMSLELRIMKVVVTTGAIRRAKLQLYCHYQQTKPQLFTGRADAHPVTSTIL